MSRSHTLVDSPIGELTLVADGGLLTGLYFPHHWYRPDPATFGARTDDGFAVPKAQLGEYLAGERRSFELEIDARGDEFQVQVWKLIDEIGYGETLTYGDLAAELGERSLAQEVGAAVGRNPLSVIVPCHRVVGAGGALTGYAGGLRRKRFLLDLEQSVSAGQPGLF